MRLIEYLMNLGSYGLAALYLSLMESSKEKLSPPAHYVLLGEIKEAGGGMVGALGCRLWLYVLALGAL